MKVFDWLKAVDLIKKNNATCAEAGLKSDWYCSGGVIFKNGKIVPKDETYIYLASSGLTPQILINGKYFDCYIEDSESCDWHAKTYWPKEAIDKLNKEELK